MDNLLSGGLVELEQCKEALLEEEAKKQAASEAEKALRAKEKELKSRKDFMEDKVSSTIKNRRGELERQHDDQIAAVRKELKAAERNKKAAKNEAVSGRINQETAYLNQENKRLKKETNALFRKWKMPAFCGTDFYLSMFSPKKPAEFAVFAVVVLLCVGVIPNAVCLLLKLDTFMKIIIYLAIVVLFAAIYALIFVATRKGKKGAVLEQARPNLEAIKANKKTIKRLAKAIKGDKDETVYNLGAYDQDIERVDAIVREKEAERVRALEEFDASTAVYIKEEIEKDLTPEINQLEDEALALREESRARQAEADEIISFINTNYRVIMGGKNVSLERIDQMKTLIVEGKAATIQQAIDYKEPPRQ
ncbi:MAG: hypothetical protein HUJ75_03475 [Parasporobacterium sp.]|nr:hypothetical protein [Parasporobacterium sp.]